MTELITFGETSLRLSPADDGRFETATDVDMDVSGTESNVAVAASALGAETAWLSKLPDTPLGHRVERALHQHGVDTEIAWADAGRQGLVFAERGPSPRPERRFEDHEACAAATVTPGELPMDRVQAADMTFVAGSTLSLSGGILETAEAVMRAAGSGFVAMDLDYRSGLWSPEEARETLGNVFDAVDILVAREDDVETVFERSGKPHKLAHAIASDHDFKTVVITRNKPGALAWHDSVIHEQAGMAVEAVDPAGQHEAFIGAFLQQVLAGAGPETALSYGVASATLTRALPGAMTTVTREEVDRLVEQL